MLVLTVMLLVLVIVSWKFGFSRTLDEWERYTTLKQAVENSADLDERIGNYENGMELIGQFHSEGPGNDPVYDHELILSSIGEFADKNNLRIRLYPPVKLYPEETYLIESNNIVLEGGFHNAVKLIYTLENTKSIGRVASVSFDLEIDKRTKKESLLTSVTIQNLKPVGDEN